MSRITAHVLSLAMAKFTEAEAELAAGDRVTFTDRHDGITRAGILLTASNPGAASHASVLADAEAGHPSAVYHLYLADLTVLTDTPDRHCDALLRAAAWWRREKYMDRPESVTGNVRPLCADALAVFAQSVKTPAGAR